MDGGTPSELAWPKPSTEWVTDVLLASSGAWVDPLVGGSAQPWYWMAD
jgi:hypothetical protein